ncbi:EAL domain-containing protein [Fontimonas sp. SYSU GA230001]|uniref:bifunctional diguanylate cyclase/phosphodiesterase n=1 Tax=Fontimonas sp. SYSU GA230001 TaxID=3142450 RepID=UPI0032B40CF0
MSLIRELWLAITFLMLLAFGGTFAISTAAARNYFQQQLFLKNVDNATTLALTMSQMDKDPVTIELLLSAQFDAGHYRLIRLTDPDGQVIIERRSDNPIEGVPAAFVAAVPLHVAPGIAQVQDGWKQYGTLTVESHDQYAYAGLWRGTLELLGWFILTAVATGIVGTALLRWILSPMQAVVGQAEAIGERRFITTREPRTEEFKRLVRAMNTLSGRVRQMVEEEAQRVEQVRRQAQIDPVTSLLNRETFVAALDSALHSEDGGSSGAIVILRVAGLAEFNRSLGRQAVDQMLRRVGDKLTAAAANHREPWVLARLNGADFAVIAPGETDAVAVADRLAGEARLALDRPDGSEAPHLPTGCTLYRRGEARAAVMMRADSALAQSEQSGEQVVATLESAGLDAGPTDLASWRGTLEHALQHQDVQLGRYPVRGTAGALLHYEAPVRVRIGDAWQPAARFIAWAARLGLMPRLDELVVETALRTIATERIAISVNVSPEAVCDLAFLERVAQRLRAVPDDARLLWIEVPEYGALQHLHEFRRLCLTLKPLGCKIGLKHAGPQFARIGELNDLGLDYLKIDGSIIQGAEHHAGHQVFLRGLCTVAHTIGLLTIAAGVRDADTVETLTELGIDGVTGPAVQAEA